MTVNEMDSKRMDLVRLADHYRHGPAGDNQGSIKYCLTAIACELAIARLDREGS